MALVAVSLPACKSALDRAPVCLDDGDPLGAVCAERVPRDTDFDVLSAEVLWDGRPARAAKFMLPVRDDPDLLPPLVQNVNRFNLHLEFLRVAFPDRFGSLTGAGYIALIMSRSTRKYFAGNLVHFEHQTLGPVYGFTVYSNSASSELLEAAEVRDIYTRLQKVIEAGPLVYTFEAFDAGPVEKARRWIDPGFPIDFPHGSELDVEVYTAGTAYGYVRRFALGAFERALRQGEVGFRDIVVVDQVPFDIGAVVAGVITGGRQWELSHVNVRMARRGTPNLYRKDPLAELAPFDQKLVRLEASRGLAGGQDRCTVREATLAEAETFWASHRPNAGDLSVPVLTERRLDRLVDLDPSLDQAGLIARVGGKAGNLALLYRSLGERYQVPAIAVPFAWFEDWMAQNSLVDARAGGTERVSYREYISRLGTDVRVQNDAAYRRALLWDLQARMRSEAIVDPALVQALEARIAEVFGGRKVRFRSSSNVEDALEFSGAGLYSSTSVCAADGLDLDRDGPSLCDPAQDEERTIERGLAVVWSSLYNARAWEERDWYQVPQTSASMAILVSEAFMEERANGVGFTGYPDHLTDLRYLINAQIGDEPVVGNDRALVPELDLLRIQDGLVADIFRERASVLTDPARVLSDEELRELGGLMASIDGTFPQDTGAYTRDQVLLDIEFKIDRDGALRIKQIRPFLERCRGVRCEQAPVCLDRATLESYRGSCDSVTSLCRFEPVQSQCVSGCAGGRCQ